MNKYKLLILITLILTLSVILRIFFGTINIVLAIPFNNPTYVLKINDALVSGDIDIRKKKTFIPYVINLNLSKWLSTEGESRLTVKQNENIILKIEAYNCFSDITEGKKLIACSYDNNKKELKKIENVKYSMVIRGGSTMGITNTLIYDGNYQDNLTTIIKEKGIYTIEISAKHSDIESIIYLLLEII